MGGGRSVARAYDVASGEAVEAQRNIVGVGEMGGAINLSADGGHLILTSWFDGDVRVWDPVAQRRVAHIPNLAAPVSAVRYAGGIAVAEHAAGGVRLHGADGQAKVLATGFAAPTGLTVEGGSLFLSDRAAGEILRIAEDGEALATPEVLVEGLQAPEGFAFFEEALFFVVEADAARVVEIQKDGSRRVLARFAGGSQASEGTPPSQVFNGIAVDADGNLLVTDESARTLLRIDAADRPAASHGAVGYDLHLSWLERRWRGSLRIFRFRSRTTWPRILRGSSLRYVTSRMMRRTRSCCPSFLVSPRRISQTGRAGLSKR